MAKRKRLGPVEAFAAAPPAAPEVKAAEVPAPSSVPIAAVAGDSAAANALAEVTSALEAARAEGRLVQKLPLDRIVTDYLIRDRLAVDAGEMTALRESLAARGQQMPIDVLALPRSHPGQAPRYGLISGWRRVTALRALGANTVLARVIAPESQAAAYEAMVEENEIRVGLSYYERARIVMRAVAEGIYPSKKQAQLALFAHVSRAKRSKIGSFGVVVEALDGALQFPTEIGERLGLELARAIDAGQGDAFRAVLETDYPNAAAEQAALRHVMAGPNPRPRAVSAPPARPSSTATPKSWPGVELREEGTGLTLSGEGVTPAFKAALKAWLAGAPVP